MNGFSGTSKYLLSKKCHQSRFFSLGQDHCRVMSYLTKHDPCCFLFCHLFLSSLSNSQWCERQKLTYVKFWRNVIRNVNFCNFFTFTLTWRICYFLLTFYVYVWRKLKFSCLFEHVIFQFCEKFWRVWKIVCFTRFYSFFLQ